MKKKNMLFWKLLLVSILILYTYALWNGIIRLGVEYTIYILCISILVPGLIYIAKWDIKQYKRRFKNGGG